MWWAIGILFIAAAAGVVIAAYLLAQVNDLGRDVDFLNGEVKRALSKAGEANSTAELANMRAKHLEKPYDYS